jgi:hypothetical protein
VEERRERRALAARGDVARAEVATVVTPVRSAITEGSPIWSVARSSGWCATVWPCDAIASISASGMPASSATARAASAKRSPSATSSAASSRSADPGAQRPAASAWIAAGARPERVLALGEQPERPRGVAGRPLDERRVDAIRRRAGHQPDHPHRPEPYPELQLTMNSRTGIIPRPLARGSLPLRPACADLPIHPPNPEPSMSDSSRTQGGLICVGRG